MKHLSGTSLVRRPNNYEHLSSANLLSFQVLNFSTIIFTKLKHLSSLVTARVFALRGRMYRFSRSERVRYRRWPGNPGGAWLHLVRLRRVDAELVGQDGRGGWSRRLFSVAVRHGRSRRGIPANKLQHQPASPVQKGGGPPSARKQLVGLRSSMLAAGTTWIIVFLGGGWWSALLSKGWWLWSVDRVELGVYKARRPGPSQSFTGLPAHHTQTKHEGLREYSITGLSVGVVQLGIRSLGLFEFAIYSLVSLASRSIRFAAL